MTVRILQFGDELELVNETTTEVVVPGYYDEPYLRIGPDGVWRNANSPATYINLDRYAPRRRCPSSADADAEPDWEQVSTEPHYVWHDHRTHWMSAEPAAAGGRRPTRRRRTRSFEWTVPLRARRAPTWRSTGVLTWTPPPSPWLVWPLYVGAGAAGGRGRRCSPATPAPARRAAARRCGRRALARRGDAGAAGRASRSHAGAIVAALLPALTAVLVAVIGFRAARRGRGAMTGLLAVVLGLAAAGAGAAGRRRALVGQRAVQRPAVRWPGPRWPLLLALGVGLVVGGIAAVRRFREPDAARPGGATRSPVPVG